MWGIFDKNGAQVARREMFRSENEAVMIMRRFDHVWREYAPHEVVKYVREVKRK